MTTRGTSRLPAFACLLFCASGLLALTATAAAQGMGVQLPQNTPTPAPAAAPTPKMREDALRAELKLWKNTPFLVNGASRKGIDNDSFVRAMIHNAFGVDVPAERDDQYNTGRFVDRKNLAPGDLVFFETGGLGPFRSRSVGVYLGSGDVAICLKEFNVVVVKLAHPRWTEEFKTARRITMDASAAPPSFSAESYGENRQALLQDIAKAWEGILFKENGTTFAGIGNDEFVREVYGAVYETELPGTPAMWSTMGKAVKQTQLQPGDLVFYDATGFNKLFGPKQAGIYIGNGEFVHALRGSAVTISKMNQVPWKTSLTATRRLDPDALARAEEARAEAARQAAALRAVRTAPAARKPSSDARKPAAPIVISKTPASARAVAAATAKPAPVARTVTATEQSLREATEPWLGTPYKLGGTSKSGVDCSAFVRAVMDTALGIQLPRTSEQQEKLGSKVDRKNLQPGDLVFFRTQGMGPFFRSRHVGVYLGNGEFAQASGKKGVNITPLSHAYWSKKYHGARRIN